MSDKPRTSPQNRRLRLTVDGWAIAAALVLALLVRMDLIRRVPW